MDKEQIRQQLYSTGDKKDFIHLHLHSDFSLKDGICKPTQYAKKAIEIGMPALAITDHGSAGSHPSFFMYCRSNNLKPIVGVEMYVQNDRLQVKNYNDQLDEIDKKVKILKQAMKHEKANKQLFNAHIDFIREVLQQPDIDYEKASKYEYEELVEKFDVVLKRLQNQDKQISELRDKLKKNQHVVLLAKNSTGSKNIIKIVSDAARNGFYYKPRTSFNFIAENKEGVIVTSACLQGIVSNVILQYENENEAKKAGLEAAKLYKDTFGDDFYIEIMVIDIDKQRHVNKILVEIAKELNINFIVTNDVHYLDKLDSKAQEISLMLGSKDEGEQVTMKDKEKLSAIGEILDAIEDNIDANHVRKVYNSFIELDRFRKFKPLKDKDDGITFNEILDIITGKKKFKRVWEFSTKDFWFKDRHQMIDTYIDQGHYKYLSSEDFQVALDNTLKLAKKIDSWDWDTKEKLPKIDTGELSSYDYLVQLVRDGWARKAEDHWYEENSQYTKRIKYELSVIRRTEMSDYFLIVADYIKFAKNNGVVVGAARGSSCGSLACYLMDITNIDPLKHDLLFERFLSMSRSMAIYDLSVGEVKEIEDKDELYIEENEFEEWFNNKLIQLDE